MAFEDSERYVSWSMQVYMCVCLTVSSQHKRIWRSRWCSLPLQHVCKCGYICVKKAEKVNVMLYVLSTSVSEGCKCLIKEHQITFSKSNTCTHALCHWQWHLKKTKQTWLYLKWGHTVDLLSIMVALIIYFFPFFNCNFSLSNNFMCNNLWVF